MVITMPRGTQDILPEESKKWQYIEDKLRKISDSFCYEEIRTPMFESTELFSRGVGDTTDIVQKEMYTFMDKGNRSITLRQQELYVLILKINYSLKLFNHKNYIMLDQCLDTKENKKVVIVNSFNME